MSLSRRQMILSLLGAGTFRLLPGCKTRLTVASGNKLPFKVNQLKTLAAASERILPGAINAGSIEYLNYWMSLEPFSRALDWKPLLNIGAIHLDRAALKNYNLSFFHCNPEQQDTILKQFQQDRIIAKGFSGGLFFQRLMVVTLEAYLSDPRYGGNRNQVGWRFIGKKQCWWAPGNLRRFGTNPE